MYKELLHISATMWSQEWPKYVAVLYVYKLIRIYVCKCDGSTVFLILLLPHSKHMSSLHK
jgi:hypothetical protein